MAQIQPCFNSEVDGVTTTYTVKDEDNDGCIDNQHKFKNIINNGCNIS